MMIHVDRIPVYLLKVKKYCLQPRMLIAGQGNADCSVAVAQPKLLIKLLLLLQRWLLLLLLSLLLLWFAVAAACFASAADTALIQINNRM